MALAQNVEPRDRAAVGRSWPVTRLLLLRPDAALPETAPIWALPLVAGSVGVFLAGLLTALGVFGRGTGAAQPLNLSAGVIALVLLAGVAGRGVAVLVQAEAACGLAGPAARERRRRRTILVACVIAQLPLALRDVGLGVLGMTGTVSGGTLIRLATSPFDPFVVWSCLVFCVVISRRLADLPTGARRGLFVGFIGYAYALKLLLVALGSLA
jgi:hypothetical protein